VEALQAVVFDLDGLLVDSEPVQMAAWERFLGSYRHQLTEPLLARMFGLRIWDSAQIVIDAYELPLTVNQVVVERDAVFFEALRDGVSPMPGAIDLVQNLNARQIPLGLATSGHRRYVDLVLDQLRLTGSFQVEVTGEQVDRGKPAPDIYLEAARLLGADPDRCIALEDAPLGIASAKAARMVCLAIPNDSTRGLAGFELADDILAGLDRVIPWLDDRRLL
jgi:HAD superfamily hydrolase (TIGR01509 family)